MTVLQIVKDLIGEEDVAWGDSDTTFDRQTHTGGTTAISYVDAKSIPANNLGGVVDTHLHTQNTDTGTTAATFKVTSGGNYAEISSSGLTGDRTFTFPDSSQALVGATTLAAVTTGKGASTVGVFDTAGYFTGTDVEAVLAELAVDVAAVASYRGYKRGFTLGYSSTTTITIGGGMWDHIGTTTQNVYTASQISFVCGSGGSNAGSDDLDASNLHYIYIDDSAVVTAGTSLLTSSEFLNDKTAPAYSHAKSGWYNGLDRCVGAVLTNGSSQIMAFKVYSDSVYTYTTTMPTEYASAAAPTAATEMDMSSSVPSFSTRARLMITATTDGQTFAYGPSATALDTDNFAGSKGTSANYSFDVLLDTGQSTWQTCSSNGAITVKTAGYYINDL